MKLLSIFLTTLVLFGCATPNDDFMVHYSSATQPRMMMGQVSMPNCWWSCSISVNVTDSEGKNLGGSVALSPSTKDNHSSATSLSIGTGGGVPVIKPSPYNGDR